MSDVWSCIHVFSVTYITKSDEQATHIKQQIQYDQLVFALFQTVSSNNFLHEAEAQIDLWVLKE